MKYFVFFWFGFFTPEERYLYATVGALEIPFHSSQQCVDALPSVERAALTKLPAYSRVRVYCQTIDDFITDTTY